MSEASSPAPRATAIVLAAGAGTRMKSSLSKVLQPLLGRPMAAFTVGAARDAGMDAVVVVHHQEDQVRAALAGPGLRFARQERLIGTGDAVASALPELPQDGVVVVLYGDCPLILADTLRGLLDAHGADRAATVVTARAPDPTGYGRLVRDANGAPLRVVEERECTPTERAIDEVNVGLYAFNLAWLRQELPRLRPHDHKGEIYLTDLIEAASTQGSLGVLLHQDIDEMMGVNDRWSLGRARRLLQDRTLMRLALAGVTFENPESTVVEAGVEIGADCTVEAGVVLRGSTRIDAGVTIGAHSLIIDSEIGPGTDIQPYSMLDGARVGAGASIGPYARLRPDADIHDGAKIGNFVEIKKSVVEAGAKVPHLSYVGDARVGAGANVGAGTITCNYDGFVKHRTDIGAGAFIGSNSALVAPVSIGAGAIIAAGSTITEDVPEQALGLARGRQTIREGWAARFRKLKQARKDRA